MLVNGALGPIFILIGGILFLAGLGRMIIRRKPPFSEWGQRFLIAGTVLGVVGLFITPPGLAALLGMVVGALTVLTVVACLNWPS